MVTGFTRLDTGEISSSCRESLRPPRNLVTEIMAESSMSTRNLVTAVSRIVNIDFEYSRYVFGRKVIVCTLYAEL